MLKIENINFLYGKASIIKDFSLNINKGEFVGMLGPNGSGKTTLLKLLSGFLSPQKGKIFYTEEELCDISTRKRARKIAVVSQENIVPFSFLVSEIVMMGRNPHLPLLGFETQEDIDIVNQVMQETDVLQFASRTIQELSGGERQRVFVARALAQRPEILLLDEPTTFLDIKHQTEIYKLIRKLNIENKLTVITVVHDINLASLFCNRIIFIKQGQKMADGEPREVVTYANICKVFDTDVYVGINDLTGMPYYVPNIK